MALATRCPHCQTTFRVAHDQLKLRAGLVRCGACKEIFNGVEHLLRPEEIPKPVLPPKSPIASPAEKPAASAELPGHGALPASAAREETRTAPDGTVRENDLANPASSDTFEKEHGGATQAPSGPDHNRNVDDPLQRMTLMDFTAFEEGPAKSDAVEATLLKAPSSLPDGSEEAISYADSADELSQAIDDLQQKPWRRAKTSSSRRSQKKSSSSKRKESAEPAFVKQARWQKKYGRKMQIGMAICSLALLVSLTLQSVYAFRNTIAVQMPQSRPFLLHSCDLLGCKLNLPAQINKVSIETSELHSLPSHPNQFTLSVLLNNQAATAQAWPDIELTLNDTNEKPIARKVFAPHDYLPPKEIEAGFPAESERTVKVSFELLQLKASGYRVYLFYP